MSTPQATYHIPGSEQEPFAPSGTKVFSPEERVDLHMSNLPLSELTRVATDLAAPMHQVSEADATDIDRKRVEFGEAVTILTREYAPSAEVHITDPLALAQIGQALVFLRLAQARMSKQSREN